MQTFRFLDFEVYQSAKQFHREIMRITKDFPREHVSLADQIRRSSLSIVLNIAEGSAKGSDKDFGKYLAIALGSVNETVAGLDIAADFGLLNQESINNLRKLSESIAKQLGGLSKKIRNDS